MSSRYTIMIFSIMRFLKILFIIVWNLERLLVMLKNITKNLKSIQLVQNTAFCYSMSVWTDLDQGQSWDFSNYQSTTDIGLGDRHVTWKSYDRVQSSLKGLRVQKDREESRWSQGQEMTSRDMGSSWCIYGICMYDGDEEV